MKSLLRFFRDRIFPKPIHRAILEEADRERDDLFGITKEIRLTAEGFGRFLASSEMNTSTLIPCIDTTDVWIRAIEKDLSKRPKNNPWNARRNMVKLREIRGPLLSIGKDLGRMLDAVDAVFISEIGIRNYIDAKAYALMQSTILDSRISKRTPDRLMECLLLNLDDKEGRGKSSEQILYEVNTIFMGAVSDISLSEFYRKRLKKLRKTVPKRHRKALSLAGRHGGVTTFSYLHSSLHEIRKASDEESPADAFERYQRARTWLACAFREMAKETGS